MRVLHVNTAAQSGGAAPVAAALGAAQRERGLSVGYLSGRPERGATGPMPRLRFLANVAAFRLAAVEAPFESGRWRSRADRIASADLVHLHNAHGYYLPDASLAALLARPCVWTLHDLWLATGRCAAPQGCGRWRTGCAPCPHPDRYPASRRDRSGAEQARRRALMRAGRIVFAVPSRDMAAGMRAAGMPAERLVVIPNPLLDPASAWDVQARAAARRALGWPDDRFTVLVASAKAGDPNKNVGLALTALARVSRPSSWHLVLLGRPDRALQRQLAGLPVATSVIANRLERAELNRAYLAADLLLNPSRGESFGMTNLEALAHGCRLICTDLPVFREVAGDAAVYLPADDAGAWTAALDAELAAWPRAPDMATAAALRRRHALDAIVDAYLALYHRVAT
ncbi:MAG: glycosyltransferase [Alphaproteobacteria bacterium]